MREGRNMEDRIYIMSKIYENYSKEEENIQEEIRQKYFKNKTNLDIAAISKGIIDLCKQYKVVDWIDEESCCYEFKILLHENQEILDDDIELIETLGGERNDLRIFFSIFDKFYYMFLEKTKYDFLQKKWYFYTIKKYSPKQKQIVQRIVDYMDRMKWTRISDLVAGTRIPDIELELIEAGQATVFNCLFTDKVDIEKNIKNSAKN